MGRMSRQLVALMCITMVIQASFAQNIVQAFGSSSKADFSSLQDDSVLYPYSNEGTWGSKRTFEEVKAMYESLFGELMGNASGVYSIYKAAPNVGDPLAPADIEHQRVETRYPGQWGNWVIGNLFKVKNPIGRFKVHEPGVSSSQGCDSNTLSTVASTAKYHKCRVATNAGFFDPHKGSPRLGECYGNLVVNGVPVRSPGTQNANFGLLKNGSYVAGYIPQEMIAHPDPEKPDTMTSDFETLVAGVVMLVKDGVNFVQMSATLENSSTQTTGSIQSFCDVVTARTAIGHDAQGNLIMFASDGQGGSDRGIALNDMANLMISFGAINAINLDGGGSTTVVRDDLCVNMPTDPCPNTPDNPLFHCERSVSSVICIEDPAPAIPPSATVPISTPVAAPVEAPVVVPIAAPITTPIFAPIAEPSPPMEPPMANAPTQAPQSQAFGRLAPGWQALIIISIVLAFVSLSVLFAFIFFGRTPAPNRPYSMISADLD